MLQVYLVRHDETQWGAERHIQGQFGNPLATKGEQQAMRATTRAKELGITRVISNDLGRTRHTTEIIAQTCDYDIIFDSRLCELNMGVLERRHIDSLTEGEENWRRQLINGIADGRIPEGESTQEFSDRISAALESYRDLPQRSWPLLVNHGIALGCLVSTILELPA